MTDKELIKQEIEYRLSSGKYSINSKQALEDIIVFIDSLPEESGCEVNCTTKNEDLEEYYKKEFLPKEWFAKPGQRTISQFNFFTAQHFAEWQKQQMKETLQTEYEKGRFDMRDEMMKDAVESEVFMEIKGSAESTESEFRIRSRRFKMDGIKLGETVKIIIIKI